MNASGVLGLRGFSLSHDRMLARHAYSYGLSKSSGGVGTMRFFIITLFISVSNTHSALFFLSPPKIGSHCRKIGGA
jgi:hypothetical protein